ncbi:MAG: class I adenylate-forming enzyme family protein [Acidimicrobiales bacterium]
MPLIASAPVSAELAAAYTRAGLWPAPPLRSAIEAIAELDGDRTALIDNDGVWTYRRLCRAVGWALGGLRRNGVAAGETVVLVAPNAALSVVAFEAILRASAVAVMLDRRAGSLDLRYAIDTTQPRLVVAPESRVASLRESGRTARVVSLESLVASEETPGWEEPDTSAPRVVVFTSGTTSHPKGVIHSLDTLGAGARNLAGALGFEHDDAPFLSSPLASITGLIQTRMALSGARIVLENEFDPAGSLARIEATRATVIGGAPIIVETLFAEYERQDLRASSLRAIALGGTMIPRTVLEVAIERFGILPTRVYGSSEVPNHTASRRDDDLGARLADDGAPTAGSEVRVGPAPDQDELLVRGPNRFLGYLEGEDNAGAFSDGWFRTGDLVTIREGRLSVRGRLKEVVARKGLKVSLTEVDAAAADLPSVLEASAFGVPDDETGERLALAVRPAAGVGLTFEVVIEQLLSIGLARWKLPEQVVVWDDPLPRTATGKVRRDELAATADGRPTLWAPRLRTTDP